MVVRKPAVAGMFYPEAAEQLTKLIQSFPLLKVVDAEIHGIVVPHAGYAYSGETAAQAFRLIEGKEYDSIILLGPNHNFSYRGVAKDHHDAWQTPLGDREVSYGPLPIEECAQEYDVHRAEHSLEVQIPFLQTYRIKGPIAPLLVGEIDEEEATKAADCLRKVFAGSKTLLIVSTDLSHYMPRSAGSQKDAESIHIIEGCDSQNWQNIDACGRYPLMILIRLCQMMHWKPTLIHRSDSGDRTGDTSSVVGYASFVF